MQKFTFDRNLGGILQGWEAGVLSTHRVKRKRTDTQIRNLYRVIGLEPPKMIVWAQSPLGAMLIMNAASRSKWNREMHNPLRNTLRRELNNSFIRVRGTPKALHTWRPRFSRIGAWDTGMWNSTTQNIQNQLRDLSENTKGGWTSVMNKGKAGAAWQMWEDVEDNVEQMGISRPAMMRKPFMTRMRFSMASTEDWISLFFMRGIKKMGQGWPRFHRVLTAHEKLQSTGVLLWLFDDLVFCSDRPTHFEVERFQPTEPPTLHCGDGPAMTFRDGTTVYAWRGNSIPGEWTNPEWLTPSRIHRERNGQTFRQMLRIYGIQRYILNGPEELDGTDDRPFRVAKDKWGELWQIPHDDVAIRAVLVENSTPNPDGTRRQYALAVPPRCETPEQGLLAVHGLPTSLQYRPIVES